MTTDTAPESRRRRGVPLTVVLLGLVAAQILVFVAAAVLRGGLVSGPN